MQSEDNINMNTTPSQKLESWWNKWYWQKNLSVKWLPHLLFHHLYPGYFSTLHFVYQWFIYFHFQLFLISYINLFSLFTWYIFLFVKIIWVSWISMKHLINFPFKINRILKNNSFPFSGSAFKNESKVLIERLEYLLLSPPHREGWRWQWVLAKEK